jgi:uncharacterized protein (UPF0297 family)
MKLWLLTNNEYTNLQDVSFLSDATVEAVQEVLKEKGFKTTLNQLFEGLKEKGFNCENRKK